MTWTNAGLLPIERLGTNVSEIFGFVFYHFDSRNAFKNVVSQNGGLFSGGGGGGGGAVHGLAKKLIMWPPESAEA